MAGRGAGAGLFWRPLGHWASPAGLEARRYRKGTERAKDHPHLAHARNPAFCSGTGRQMDAGATDPARYQTEREALHGIGPE